MFYFIKLVNLFVLFSKINNLFRKLYMEFSEILFYFFWVLMLDVKDIGVVVRFF